MHDGGFVPDVAVTVQQEKHTELSEMEKKEIDEALKVDYVLAPFFYLDGHFSKDEAKTIVEAQQKILSFGSRGLRYLKEQMIQKDPYPFAAFASGMAQEGDLEVIEEVVFSDKIIHDSYEGAARRLNRSLQGMICKIKRENPESSKLQDIANEIINMYKEGVFEHNHKIEKSYMDTLFLTDVTSAKNFYKTNGKHLHNYWSGIPEGLINIDEYEEELKADNIKFITLEDVSKYWDSRGSFELNNKESHLLKKSEQIVEKLSLEETIEPVARLYVFNQLSKGTDERIIKQKTKKLNSVEKAYEGFDLLPTIGIEVECPSIIITNRKLDILEELEVSNYEESEYLWEVNADFTYSPLAQSRYLQELVEMEFIFTDKNENGKEIPEDYLLSLHVNLGFPTDVNFASDIMEQEAYILNDVLNYAFTSPSRIRERKTNCSLYIDNDAIDNKKFKRKQNKKSDERDENDVAIRLELRATEFRNYKTYKMLTDAQKLGAMFFSYVKSIQGKEITDEEIELENSWKEFKKEYQKIMKEKNIQTVNMIDKEKNKAASLMEDDNLRQKCQQLISKYAKYVNKLITKKI